MRVFRPVPRIPAQSPILFLLFLLLGAHPIAPHSAKQAEGAIRRVMRGTAVWTSHEIVPDYEICSSLPVYKELGAAAALDSRLYVVARLTHVTSLPPENQKRRSVCLWLNAHAPVREPKSGENPAKELVD
jgi:hypothetical protein